MSMSFDKSNSKTLNSDSGHLHSVIENRAGYQFLATISMLCMSIMLCNAVLTNCYIGVDTLFVLGGTLASSFVFLLEGVIAEIYGYKIARCVIMSGFVAQALFTFICQAVVMLPHPHFFKEETAYAHILGSSLVLIGMSGFFAYMIANLFNAYIISKWKFLLKSRRFWLRSLGVSTFSEGLYYLIAILMMEFQSLPLRNVMKVILISYLIKAFYSLIFAKLATILVNYIKKTTGINVYNFPKNFTPFKYANLGSIKE